MDVGAPEQFAGHLVVEVVGGGEDEELFARLRLLLVLFLDVFHHLFDGFVFLYEVKSLDGTDVFDGVAVVAAAENAEVDELFHGQSEFLQHIGQTDFSHRLLFGFDAANQSLGAEGQAVHVVRGNCSGLFFFD